MGRNYENGGGSLIGEWVRFHLIHRKFLLNLALGEPLSLVQELPLFHNMIKMKLQLETTLELCVHDMINVCFFHAVMVELYWCQLLFYL
jgi:hypothetical protein